MAVLRTCGRHASGGLGRVSIANDIQFGRQVAIKEMHRKYAGVASHQRRFLREAEITGQLEHPGIVPVYVLGNHENGEPFYVMRLIQGRSMSDAIKRTGEISDAPHATRARRQLLNSFVDVCQSVEYAHSRGVIHRDIKPANIMLGDFGETLLVDWGLAKSRSESDPAAHEVESGDAPDRTHAGTILGTPSYMSPEQATGDNDRVGHTIRHL